MTRNATRLVFCVLAVLLFVSGCAEGPPINLMTNRGRVAASGGTQPELSREALSAGIRAPEELWIIARPTAEDISQTSDMVGSGELLALREDRQPAARSNAKILIPFPLKHTDVRAFVSGYIGTVQVKQEFQNPYDTKIEAIYVFPLPHNAAVSEFIMAIGERRIRGIIRDRKEAEEIYQQAKSQGYVASLLTEERPNIFRQSVANIEPGKQIDVNITYFQTLAYADGWYEFVFPMVVGPRYNPADMTNGVGVVPLGQTGDSGQNTEVSYLSPDERNGHDLSLRLDVNVGVDIEEFVCPTHRVIREASDPEHLSVTLATGATIPNKDFNLRYRVAGERIKSNLLVQRGDRGGYFTMMIYPPRELQTLPRASVEMVFVLDCSGSMYGRPIEQAKAVICQGLRLLRPGDSFQIINFSEKASLLGAAPLEATPANIKRGLDYVAALNSDGPTEMIEGIKAALVFPHDSERLRFVCFLTDGYIGNEAEILAAVHQKVAASRIFSVGVGTAPNRYLLDHLAKQGRGAVAYLGLHDDAAKLMDDFFERISHPAMTDVQVDWGALQVAEVYPSRAPDLFVGRPTVLTGRFSGGNASAIRITGRTGGQSTSITLPDNPTALEGNGKALAHVWARAKIAELADRATYDSSQELPNAIKQTALDYGLLSAYTAFIAVDSTQTTEGSESVTVPVTVPVSAGVKYDKTVQDNEKENPK